ncbi:MAG: hypothetical protein KDA99_18535, partial [Planctomycetales bacterium]|nr:hypothetical protein [Planctomycetales bacterium]
TQWRRWPNPAAQGDTPPPPGFPAPAGTPGHESIDKRDERRVAPEAPRAMSAAPMAAGVLNGMTMPAVETPVYEGPLTSEPQPEMDGPLEVPKSVPELPATNEEASVAPPPTAPEVPPVAVAAPQPHSSRRTTSRVAAATSNAAEIVVGDQPPVRHAANNAAVALAGDNASDANPLRATNSLGSPNPLR